MGRVCVIICIAFVALLALVSSGAFDSSSQPVNEAQAGVGDSVVVLQSGTNSTLAIWLRLRWIFAGSAAAGLFLLCVRQARLIVAPPTARQSKRLERHAATGSNSDVARRELVDDAYGIAWSD